MEVFGSEIALQSCPKLRQSDQAFIDLYGTGMILGEVISMEEIPREGLSCDPSATCIQGW